MEAFAAFGARVVHRLPGRARVRFETAGGGWGVARSLVGHPHVRGLTWSSASRSLVVRHDPAVSAEAILAEARAGDQVPPPEPPRLDLGLLLTAAELLLPAPVQLAVRGASLLRRPVTLQDA